MSQKMDFIERISIMKENLGNDFKDEGKKILADGKILKGRDAKENFNTELNQLTFEIEELYPLNYEEFKANFPNTIALVNTVQSINVIDAVNKGLVIQGLAVKTNVDKTIENIKENIKDPEKAQIEIDLRNNVFKEIQRMKDDFEIEWCEDIFWKCWKIKEGEKQFENLLKQKGETLTEKRIKTIENIGGIEFLKALQKEVYPEK